MPSPINLKILLIERRGGLAGPMLVGRPGFEVIYAERLTAVERLLLGNKFHIIVMDLSEPELGLDAFRQARSLLPGIPFVTLMEGGNFDYADALVAEGAQACLEKEGLDARALVLAVRQAALRGQAEARRFRAIFDSVPIGILLAAGRRVAMANPSALELLGFSQADLNRISVLDLFPTEARAALEKALDSGAIETIAESQFRARVQRKDGSAAPCQVYVKGALLNDAPAVALYLAPMEAESSHEAEFQTRKMDALGRMAAGIAHDFNNLLTAINGYSEHLLSMPGTQGLVASGLKAIRKAGDSATEITRNLLVFGKGDDAPARPLKVDEVLAEMEPELRGLLGPEIELQMSLEAGEETTQMDRGQFERLIRNLCVNAKEAMPKGGTLTVSAELAEVTGTNGFTHLVPSLGRHILVSIGDTGTGMLPETIESLFEPFYTTKSGGRGTGMGLAAVYGIVHQAGGGIAVSSRRGQGSWFRIFLGSKPTAAQAKEAEGTDARTLKSHGTAENVHAAESQPGRSSAPATSLPDGSRETVLVVEDEPSLRDMLRTILERYGFTVLEAVSLDEAMETVTARPEGVDLVVTDVMLRGGTGHELGGLLQEHKPGLRVVYISGHSLETLADQGIHLPSDAFLEKPFTPSQLALKVREMLDAAGKIP